MYFLCYCPGTNIIRNWMVKKLLVYGSRQVCHYQQQIGRIIFQFKLEDYSDQFMDTQIVGAMHMKFAFVPIQIEDRKA